MSRPAESDPEAALRAAEERIFTAIRTRDLTALAAELAPDFVHSSPGNPDQPRSAFLDTVRELPFEIRELGGDDVRVRVLEGTAIVSGIQRARVALPDGQVVSAATAFADWFVESGDGWRLRHAFSVELPPTP